MSPNLGSCRVAAPVVGVRALAAAAAACATMLMLSACALAIPRSRDLHVFATRLEADLDAIETLIAERRSPGDPDKCRQICAGGGKPKGNTAADAAMSLRDEKYSKFDTTGFAIDFVSNCIAACIADKYTDAKLELPLKADSSKTEKTDIAIYIPLGQSGFVRLILTLED